MGWIVNNDGTVSYGNTRNGAIYGNALFTISELKSDLNVIDNAIKGISLNGTVVTLSSSILSTGKVGTTGDYTLALDSDIAQSDSSQANWTVSDTTAIYNSASSTAGYSPANDGKSVTYSAGGDSLNVGNSQRFEEWCSGYWN